MKTQKSAAPNNSGYQQNQSYQPNQGSQTKSAYPGLNLGKNTVLIQRVFKWTLFGVAGFLIVLNIQPYLEVAKVILAQVKIVPFQALLERFAPTAVLLSLFGLIGAHLLGFLLWLLIQICQVMSLYVNNDLQYLAGTIATVGNSGSYEVHDDDSAALKKLKENFNDVPTRYVKFWSNAAFLAYVVEFAICAFRFPPYVGGVKGFMADLWVWSMDKIDWKNFLLMAVTMFAVEGIVRVLNWFAARRYFS